MKTTSIMLIGAIAFLGACSSSTGPGSASRVSLSLSTGSTQPSFSLAAADSMSDGQNDLVLTSVELVLREIELKRVETTDCDVVPEPEGCEKFETGPMVMSLPLDGATAQVLAIDIEPGSYDRVEFDIHKVSSDDPADAAFRAARPDLVGTSVRVRGRYNGRTFDFVSDLMEKQEYALVPPIDVVDGASTNVTLHLDIAGWFRDASGGLVDPASANKGAAHENLVKDNIRTSIDAYKDDDRDGRPE